MLAPSAGPWQGSKRAALVASSAGGWISRIFLGRGPPYCNAVFHGADRCGARACGLGARRDAVRHAAHARAASRPNRTHHALPGRVHTLVTLGTPHTSAEPVTLRNIGWVNDNQPLQPDVRCVCVCVRACVCVCVVRRSCPWLA
jgi:triacylglycerol esterase/lipase EstA (alpha/beta hydrolase family)